MTSNTTNQLSLRFILEKDKLNGTNFRDWYKNLRIIFKQEKKSYVLEEPISEPSVANAARADRDAYKKHQDDALEVRCFMLVTMNSELQKQHENMNAFDMIVHFKRLYQEQTHHERFNVSKALFQCKMVERSPVETHVLKMIGYIENLERLGFPLG